MTTATRRLRRAGVAGLATVATVGGLVLATGGTALAWNGGAITPAVTPTNVFPGTAGAAASDLALTLPNVAWNIGDTITETVVNAGNCSTAANTIGFASAPTLTASLASNAASTSTKPTGTVALSSSSGACTTAGVKDILTITLTNSGNNSADANGAPTLTLSPMKFNLGAGPIAAANITLHATVAGTGTVPTLADVNLAAIKNTNVTVSSSQGVSSGSTITVGTVTVTDVTGTNVTGDVTFTLSGATDAWTSAGTLSAPSGVTLGTAQITGNALKFPISAGTIPAGAKFTLTGAKATLNGAGSHTVTVTSNAGANPIGAATQVAFVATPTRIGGADRYATAALIYNQQYSNATTAVIASGANFPDALSATVLASAQSTGVLLTDPNTLSSATKQALITGTGPVSTVYIVGGTAAVSSAVETQIAALKNSAGNAINVIRVAGPDRYATNEAVNLQAGVNGTTGGTAIIATGQNFPDALAAGPAVYDTGLPLILTPSASLGTAASATISALGINNAVILGGTSAVSTGVETALTNAGVTVTNRLAGADRTLTAAEIAKWELTPIANTFAETGYAGNKGLGFSGATVNVARGDTYPDALASGAWLGNIGQVLLVTNSPTSLGSGIPSLLAGAAAAPPAGYGTSNVNGIGLAAALSAGTLNAALGAIS